MPFSANLMCAPDSGRLLTICDTELPPAYPVVPLMNFDENFVNKTLLSLNWATADENHKPSKWIGF